MRYKYKKVNIKLKFLIQLKKVRENKKIKKRDEKKFISSTIYKLMLFSCFIYIYFINSQNRDKFYLRDIEFYFI